MSVRPTWYNRTKLGQCDPLRSPKCWNGLFDRSYTISCQSAVALSVCVALSCIVFELSDDKNYHNLESQWLLKVIEISPFSRLHWHSTDWLCKDLRRVIYHRPSSAMCDCCWRLVCIETSPAESIENRTNTVRFTRQSEEDLSQRPGTVCDRSLAEILAMTSSHRWTLRVDNAATRQQSCQCVFLPHPSPETDSTAS